MTRFYVLRVADARSSVLDLEGDSRWATAKRAINWQVVGGGRSTDYRICTYSKKQNAFIDHDAPENRYQPDRGPYTEEAWAEFCRRLGYDPDADPRNPGLD